MDVSAQHFISALSLSPPSSRGRTTDIKSILGKDIIYQHNGDESNEN
jgi:hypothetical protein